MLDRLKTRVDRSFAGAKLLSTLTTTQIVSDGQPMIAVREGDDGVYRPSNGTADTIFAGFSMFEERVYGTTATKVEEVTAVGTVATLSKTPNSTTDILCFNMTSSAVLTYTDGAGATGQFDVDANIITLNAAQSGAKLRVTYKYDISAVEALALYGSPIPGPSAVMQLMSCTLVQAGEIYTDQFDAGVNWAAIDTDASGEVLKARANGLVSVNGNGAIIRGHVTQVPNVNSPFLGIRFSV